MNTTIFKCPTCELTLLVRQLLVTTDHEKFICPSCNHVFNNKNELRMAVKEANIQDSIGLKGLQP